MKTLTLALVLLSFWCTRAHALTSLNCQVSSNPNGFALPVEVLGAEGVTEIRSFQLTREQLHKADRVFFFANNLSYENKGSIQINGEDWIKLNHSDIDIYDKEMGYGGMQHGAMNSIRFTIPSDDLVEGHNSIKFRFDTSDGISNGYRIFRFNLLDNEGKSILPETFFNQESPCEWQAPQGYEGKKVAYAGKVLWYTASLWGHYLSDDRWSTWYGNKILPRRKIKATCSDCHTQDGRDLAYFAYSNKAIIERSKFHGLSEDEGNKIAAYIRSLDIAPHGRPWNPPYQPGPSVGEKPVEYWAAGAGIDAVLENDADMLPYMFPNGTSQQQIDDYFDSDKMYDTTTVPIAVQFPDWKHWLPMVHPMDAYGNFYAVQTKDGMLRPGKAYPKHNPFINYILLRNYLEKHNHDQIVEDKEGFYNVMGNFWASFRQFYTDQYGKKTGGHWRTTGSLADRFRVHQGKGYGQFGRTSTARLMAVKFFEIHQEFKLEEMTQRLIPAKDQPAPRQWVHAMGYNVFEVPPHFSSCAFNKNTASCGSYIGQPWITGVFESSNWYELQLIINPGNGRPGTVGPVDFNYHPGFIRKSSSQGQPHLLRYFRAMNNVYQVKSFSGDLDDYSNKKKGFLLHQQGPWNIMPWNAPGYSEFEFTQELEKVKPNDNLPVKLVNAMLTQLAVELEKPQNLPKTYKRSQKGGWFSLESKSKSEYNPKGKAHADDLYRFFLRIKESGMQLDAARVNRVLDWCEDAWPRMDWDALRA